MLHILSKACGHRHSMGQASVLSHHRRLGSEVAYQRAVAMEAVGWGEGSLCFSGFGGLNCNTCESGTSYTICEDLGPTVVLTTLCCSIRGTFLRPEPIHSGV